MFRILLWLFVLALSVLAAPDWKASPFSPPSIPLVVKSPYLSAWLPQGGGKALNSEWPTYSDGSIVAFAGFIQVDSKVYQWIGPQSITGVEKAVQTSMQFTSTQSIFVLNCGTVDLTATFLSPVEPTDLVNQSIPFSYVGLSASSNDDSSHSVKIYLDITGEWLGSQSLQQEWSTTVDTVITHKLNLQNQTVLAESGGRALYGSVFFSTPKVSGTTYQSSNNLARNGFIANGTLPDTQNNTFRAIGLDWQLFAFAQDLGTVDWETTGSTVFSLGFVRDPVVQFMTAQGPQDRSPLFLTRFAEIKDLIVTFLADYPNALARANAFDAKVNNDAAAAVGPESASDYAGLVSLSIRQLLGTLDITVPTTKSADGTYDTDDIMIFMRDGNVNTVDIIFPAWPAFLYLNPAIGKYMLLPHYKFQKDGLFPYQYAAHDLGAVYPMAIGSNVTAMPIEETGNQLIMALSYVQKTNDTSVISKYSDLLDQWVEYLILNSLNPPKQFSTNSFAGPLVNSTNLAIKGILGIKAASEIWKILGDNEKSENHSAIAQSYAVQLLDLGISSDKSHLVLNYGNDTSWGLMYNLYADMLLGTNLFPESVYKMQTAFYDGQRTQYGIQLDSRGQDVKTDWQMWTAATVTDTKFRASMIKLVINYLTNGLNSDPLPDWYRVDGKATPLKTRARPVVGGHLALLMVKLYDENTLSGQDPPETGGASGLAIPSVFHLVFVFIVALMY